MTDSQVHLILGEEQFFAERARTHIINAIGQEVERTTVRTSDLTEAELIELTSPSLFAEDRIIVFTNTEEAGKAPTEMLLEAAINPGPGIFFIIHHKGGGRNKALVPKFQKISEVYHADPLRPREITGWVMKEFSSYNVRPAPDVINLLIDGVGTDPRELASAVSQLVADTGGKITEHTVRAYYSGKAEISAFDLADQMVSGDTVRAVASARRALQLGEDPVRLTAALASKVGLIARLHSTRGGSPEQLARQIGVAPYPIKLALPVARRWSSANVDKAVVIMAELEARLKGEGGDTHFAFEDAVRRIAELAR